MHAKALAAAVVRVVARAVEMAVVARAAETVEVARAVEMAVGARVAMAAVRRGWWWRGWRGWRGHLVDRLLADARQLSAEVGERRDDGGTHEGAELVHNGQCVQVDQHDRHLDDLVHPAFVTPIARRLHIEDA